MNDAVTTLRSELNAEHRASRPMMRWWWFGPAVERDELERELSAMAQAGIGGVEIAFVYPLAEATTTFGSPEMLADVRWATDRARELGLRVDLTLGSGWPYGGPHITADLAARRVHWDRHDLPLAPHQLQVRASLPTDALIAAYLVPSSVEEPVTETELIEPHAADSGWLLDIPTGVGPRHLLLAWSRPTGQQVKRAAAGAEGPVLDHYSAAATEAHLRAVADPLLDAVPGHLLGSVFCDSLEIYHADWTHDLPAEFERRRGYPLLPRLPQLLQRDGLDAHSFRADYHRTLTDLYEERFVAKMQAWAAGRGVPFRIQGYGTPPATMSSYRFADAVEGEGWGWKELAATRWASSAAHHYGHDVVSCESWTWVHSPSFRATPLDLLGEAHEHLLNGVTLFIGHGWPYSPVDAPGLGWFFYAAGCLDDRNPWWPVMPAFTRQLTRLSWLLRQGDRVADVAVYVPTQDLLADSAAGLGGRVDLWRSANAAIGPEVLAPIRRAGLDYDLVDDDVLTEVGPEPPAVVIVPGEVRLLPEVARAWLQQAVDDGTTVLVLGAPIEVTGSRPVTTAQLASELRRAVAAPYVEDSEIGSVHRRIGGLDVRFLANTAATPEQVTVTVAGSWQLWSPATGEVTGSGTGPAAVGLAGYEATVLVSGPGVAEIPAAEPTKQRRLDDRWQVSFPGEPAQPVTLPDRWEDDPARAAYSGGATYTTTVDLPEVAVAVLDLGEATPLREGPSPLRRDVGAAYRAAVRAPVGEVALVRVNGVDCGAVFAPPYRVDVTGAVQPGTNTIEITVYNTAANKLGHDTEITALVDRTEERYGRRFVMQELDKALDDVSSGLLQVPILRFTRS